MDRRVHTLWANPSPRRKAFCLCESGISFSQRSAKTRWDNRATIDATVSGRDGIHPAVSPQRKIIYYVVFIAFNINHSSIPPLMALNSLYCADVPLSNYSLTHFASADFGTRVVIPCRNADGGHRLANQKDMCTAKSSLGTARSIARQTRSGPGAQSLMPLKASSTSAADTGRAMVWTGSWTRVDSRWSGLEEYSINARQKSS